VVNAIHKKTIKERTIEDEVHLSIKFPIPKPYSERWRVTEPHDKLNMPYFTAQSLNMLYLTAVAV
jgi:hypothetical protein